MLKTILVVLFKNKFWFKNSINPILSLFVQVPQKESTKSTTLKQQKIKVYALIYIDEVLKKMYFGRKCKKKVTKLKLINMVKILIIIILK